jgi:hypothetical protein
MRKPPTALDSQATKLQWIRESIDEELGVDARWEAKLYGAVGAVEFALRKLKELKMNEPTREAKIAFVKQLLDNGIEAYIKQSKDAGIEPSLEGFMAHVKEVASEKRN